MNPKTISVGLLWEVPGPVARFMSSRAQMKGEGTSGGWESGKVGSETVKGRQPGGGLSARTVVGHPHSEHPGSDLSDSDRFGLSGTGSFGPVSRSHRLWSLIPLPPTMTPTLFGVLVGSHQS